MKENLLLRSSPASTLRTPANRPPDSMFPKPTYSVSSLIADGIYYIALNLSHMSKRYASHRVHLNIPSNSSIPRWISFSCFASSARISFGARCSITSYTTSL